MLKKILFSFIALALFSVSSYAFPQPKGSDIFLVDFNSKNGKYIFSEAVNITNREGYDNQPSFSPDGNGLFFTSIRENDQSDIYEYDLKTGKTSRITETPESEFSPVVMHDEKNFSSVRVESDGSQRLWKFSTDGKNPEIIIPTLMPVGYYSWINENNVALFILGEHNTLQIFNTETGKLNVIQPDIGRSLQKIPGRNSISFVHKISEKNWMIKEFNPDNNRITNLAPVLEGREDMTWTQDGTMLMAKGSLLFKWFPGKDKNWVKIANFSKIGVKEILRLTVNPGNNKLAFVSNID